MNERSELAPAAALFHSLADPVRLAIVQRLACGEARVVDLTGELGLAQSTVSKHLACLRDCRLVDYRAEGRQSFYFVARPELLDLLRSAEQLLAATGQAVALCPVYGLGRTPGSGSHMTALTLGPSPRRRAVLRRRIRLLVAATITYNVVEAIVAITAGTARLLHGADRVRPGLGHRGRLRRRGRLAVLRRRPREPGEGRAAHHRAVVLRPGRLRHRRRRPRADRHRRGRALHRGPGAGRAQPGRHAAAVAAQRRAGRELGSASAVADSKQTLLCTYLSAVLLVGLALNSLFGWSWADPIAALVIAAVAVKEGREAWRGDACCARPPDHERPRPLRGHRARRARRVRVRPRLLRRLLRSAT